MRIEHLKKTSLGMALFEPLKDTILKHSLYSKPQSTKIGVQC